MKRLVMIDQRRGTYGWRHPWRKVIHELQIAGCVLTDHHWRDWRVETDYRIVRVDRPVRDSWRTCSRCGLIQTIMEISTH